MYGRLDGERASSYLIAVVAVVLVAGLLLEYSRVDPDAASTGAAVAGGVYVAYAAGATVYLLSRDHAGTTA